MSPAHDEPAAEPASEPATEPATGRSIDVEIEVPGSPEQVWEAIASGAGVSSWYVPHDIEPTDGGAVSFSFGPGMEGTGRVAAWDPPHRLVIDNGDTVGLAFEWLVEARDGGTCVVRLVNSGFGSGADWDDQFDGMTEGWGIFLANLRLHLERFVGQAATPMLPMAMWAGPRSDAWQRLLGDFGLSTKPSIGDRIAGPDDAPPFVGTVVEVGASHALVVLDEPAPGTAFLTVEGNGDVVGVSVWSYLYGPERATIVDRDTPRWSDWLGARGLPPG